MRRFGYPILIATLAALAVPGSAPTAEAKETTVIRIATLVPRSHPFVRDLMKLDKDLRKATDDEVGIRVYPGGVAGDEKDVIRKMRVGQMDGGSLTTTGLGQISRTIAVLDAPGIISNFNQLDAVRKALRPEWEQALLDNGVKLVAWSAAGQYRMFSAEAITKPDDLKRMRPWLLPESYTMRELWSQIGATGIPLGIPEVYGALQTGMIDTVIATAMTFTSLQWHLKLKHMTKQGTGMLNVSLVVSKDKWEQLSKPAQEIVLKIASENAAQGDKNSVRDDKRAYDLLLKRGYTANEWTADGEKAWYKLRDDVRERLTGRIYPPELVKRAQAVAAKAK